MPVHVKAENAAFRRMIGDSCDVRVAVCLPQVQATALNFRTADAGALRPSAGKARVSDMCPPPGESNGRRLSARNAHRRPRSLCIPDADPKSGTRQSSQVQTAKSLSFAPLASLAASHFGCRPRPVQVSSGLSLLRNLTATFAPFPRLPARPAPVSSSIL